MAGDVLLKRPQAALQGVGLHFKRLDCFSDRPLTTDDRVKPPSSVVRQLAGSRADRRDARPIPIVGLCS
jgi:hypothetical protein